MFDDRRVILWYFNRKNDWLQYGGSKEEIDQNPHNKAYMNAHRYCKEDTASFLQKSWTVDGCNIVTEKPNEHKQRTQNECPDFIKSDSVKYNQKCNDKQV